MKTRAASVLALVVLVAALIASSCVRGAKPIVILISLDGWRHDYLARAEAPTLRALAERGVRAEGLIPAFPSLTFPNHYTVVTGLYTENHGIVGNVMEDDAIGERFSMSADTARDSRWWSGEPLWVTAEKQGQRAASMFWPGSEVEIGGVRPSHWSPYQDDFPYRDRVNKVLEWLRLPEQERPTFITLYFSEVDSVGHRSGPESAEVLEAAARLDAEVAALIAGVQELGLDDAVHYVIVSDHGMSQLSADRVIVMDDYLDASTVQLVGGSPVMGLAPREGATVDGIVTALKGKHPHLAVYRREETPEHLHYRKHPRIPPVIAVADDGWLLATRAQVQGWQPGRPFGGAHGYDPALKSMQGLLIVAGPSFRQGEVVPPIESIHLYEMMARVLGLKPAPNDGSRAATAGFFR